MASDRIEEVSSKSTAENAINEESKIESHSDVQEAGVDGTTQTEIPEAAETMQSETVVSVKKKPTMKKKGPRSLADPVIMENAYYICHDMADFMFYRGYKQGSGKK